METLPAKPSIHDLKAALLAALEAAQPRSLNKVNLIGRPNQRGDLENRLGPEFDGQGRSLAAKAFDELRSSGFIEPTYSDIVAPEDWVVITDSGRAGSPWSVGRVGSRTPGFASSGCSLSQRTHRPGS